MVTYVIVKIDFNVIGEYCLEIVVREMHMC